MRPPPRIEVTNDRGPAGTPRPTASKDQCRWARGPICLRGTKKRPGDEPGRFCKSDKCPRRARGRSGFGFADFALAFEGGALFHLQADGIDRAGDDGGGGEAARIKIAVADDFAFDDGLLGFEISFDRGVLPDRQAAFGGDVSLNGTIEDEIGRTVEISFNLDVAG